MKNWLKQVVIVYLIIIIVKLNLAYFIQVPSAFPIIIAKVYKILGIPKTQRHPIKKSKPSESPHERPESCHLAQRC